MTDFDDILVSTAAYFDALGSESITVTDTDGTERTINALIERGDMVALGRDAQTKMLSIRIDVANDATTGVAVDEEIIGITFHIPSRKGLATTKDYVIREGSILSQNAGRVVFGFGK